MKLVGAEELSVVEEVDHSAAFVALDGRAKVHRKEALKEGFFRPRIDN